MISAAVQQRRQQQFDAARTRVEVDRLLQQWQREDDAAARAEDWRTKQVAEHGRRLDRLERSRGPSDVLVDALADALAQVRKEMTAEFTQKLAEIERKIPRFCGVHEAARTYPAHSFVVKSGSLWISLAETAQPPGTPAWQLCTKSGEAR
jgi:hypothetical protein